MVRFTKGQGPFRCVLVHYALQSGRIPIAEQPQPLCREQPFKYDADGGTKPIFQNESPGNDREGNWLPAPKGALHLTVRLYAPQFSPVNEIRR